MKFYKRHKLVVNLIILFILSRIPLIIFYFKNGNFSFLNSYDGLHYISIAQSGYTEELQYAFFPLFPLLIRLLGFIGIPHRFGGILISNICSLASLLLFNSIISDKHNKILSKNIIYFVFTPILVFCTMCYTESLYILLTLLSFKYYKEKKYIITSIFVGLSILTRNSGIILWGAIGLDMLYRFFKKKDIKFFTIIIFGIISLLIGMLYPMYLYFKTNNPFMFVTIQKTGWNKSSGYFILTLIADIKYLLHSFSIYQLYLFIENWFSFSIGLIIALKIRKKDFVCFIYLIVSLFAFTLVYRDTNYWNTLPSISLFRYVLSLFPIYLYLPVLFNNKTKQSILLISLIFLTSVNIYFSYVGAFVG